MKLLKYLIWVLFFFINLVFIFTLSRGDTFVNYGFSYALRIGEIPYKDFNMVISPLAPFLYSIGLFLHNNILIYYLEQSILLTVLFYYLEKLLKEKIFLFLFILLLPYPIAFSSVIFPGYNFLILFLMILFIYYYQNSKNNYLLGFLLGLIFSTKQTIGLVLFLPTFYFFFQERKKFYQMTIGYLIPCFSLIIYLFLQKNFHEFMNLCFYGLFDFKQHNEQINPFYLCLFLFGILYFIGRIWNEKNNILLYYSLLFSSVVFPIIDYYHVSLFLIIPCYFIIEKISIKPNILKYVFALTISICFIWSFVSYQYLDGIHFDNENHFNLVIHKKTYSKNSKQLLAYVDKLDKDVIYFMRGSENFYYKIIHDQSIDYFDLPNYGNYGYHGISKMKKKIDSLTLY